MPSFRLASAALALTTFAGTVLAQDYPEYCTGTCQSFGVDFESGGSYFQNSLSTDPFTAVQEFEGCQNDTSNNVLVDPNGDQYMCSDTPLQPDDTPELTTCPVDKDQLYTGEWSLLIISNNGGCEPIAYERDFYLSVGPQQTVTVIPTVTVTSVFTPVQSSTVTSTQTITSTARPSTSTVPLINLNPTITIFPLPQITQVTKALLTLTSTSQIPNVVATATETATATCQLPPRNKVPDPLARIVATILGNLPRDAEPTPAPRAHSATTEFKRAIIEGRAVEPKVKAAYLAERREKLALNKRAPDEPVITVTDTADASTIFSTLTAPTSTIVGTTTLINTATTTPVVTVTRGINLSIATVTAAVRTITNTFFIPATTSYITRTADVTLTVTSKTTPAAVVASCSSIGGTVV